MWVNEGDIANLLSIPQLEKDGFRVTSDTHGEWIVHLPRGEKFVFKRDTGTTANMPYIDVCDIAEAFAHANIEAGGKEHHRDHGHDFEDSIEGQAPESNTRGEVGCGNRRSRGY